ncbi:MAG: dUTP diphosphatase [Fidelibacterota bacterium]
MILRVKPLHEETAKYYHNHGHFHDGDAGFDIFIVEEVSFAPRETKAIHLGIACETEGNVPYFLIPRSSISKTPLRMSNSIGLIDGGYRGEITAYCDNISDHPYTVAVGQRLFQLVSMDGSPIEFTLVDKLTETSRGAGGFGSTGS